MDREASSNRFSFCSATLRFKLRKDTSDASRISNKRSTIASESQLQAMRLKSSEPAIALLAIADIIVHHPGQETNADRDAAKVVTGRVSKGVLNMDLWQRPFETAKPLDYSPLLRRKPALVMPSIPLKTKGTSV